MHFDTTRQIGIEMRKLDAIIQHANTRGLTYCKGQQLQVHFVARLAHHQKRKNTGRTSNEQTDAHNERRQTLNYIQERLWNHQH